MKTYYEVEAMLASVEKTMDGSEDSEDPAEIIRETLLWVLGIRADEDLQGFFTE